MSNFWLSEKKASRHFAVENRPGFDTLIDLTSDDQGGRKEEKRLK
jgi:hypothetical protein